MSMSKLRLVSTILGLSLSVLMCLALTACSNIEPWVKPYERANLADPIMQMSRNPVSDAYIHHIYQVREGARGAEGGEGGGCGCN